MWNCDWMSRMPFGVGNFFWGLGPFGGLLGLLFLVFVVYLIFKIIKSLIPNSNAASDKYDSLGLLKTRLANGEISPEEYQRMKEILSR